MEEQRIYRPDTKEKIFFVLTQLFFITILLQYNDWISGVITGGMMLHCILYNGFREKWRLLKERKYITWMFLFFLWTFISLITSHDINEGFRYLDPRLPLWYFPLTIGLVQVNRKLKQSILLGFAVIVTIYCLACLFFGINNYIKSGNVDFLYNDALTVLTDQQSIYISLLVNFSIYIYAWFIFFTKNKYKPVLIVAVLFLFGMSYMLASRNMMAVLYFSTIGFIGYRIVKRKKYIEGAAIIMAITLGGFAIFTFFPKTLNRFKDLVYTQFEYNREAPESHYSAETTANQWNGTNFRMAAWRCGWELFKKNPVTGTGLGDKKAELTAKYKEKDFQFAIRTKKNLHNNYLDIMVGTGIIGLLLFFIGWLLLPLRLAFQSGDGVAILIMLTFAAAMITEVYFDRSFGGLLFGFFVPFLLTDGKKDPHRLSLR